ncbi:hypothetical protein Tco_0419835, partial [Tanacetum coccineum]
GGLEMKGDCSDVVGLVYGRDQGKHLNVDGFVDVDWYQIFTKERKTKPK